MTKLLTTKGISFFLDELFKSSKEYIYIVSPYLKINKQLEERINEALDNGVKIVMIYGKDKNQLNQIPFSHRIELYYYEHLHAKFYMNESRLLITSMNMHAYSEANNREIGVLFSKGSNEKCDLEVINDSFKEFESIKKHSEQLNGMKKVVNQPTIVHTVNENKSNKEEKQIIPNNYSSLTFEQQIFKQFLKEYNKQTYSKSLKLTDVEFKNFIIAFQKGTSEIEKIIASDIRFSLKKNELLDCIERTNQFTIVKILEFKKDEDDFDRNHVFVEILKTGKRDWYYSAKELPLTIVNRVVAVKLNEVSSDEKYFNQYKIL